ncbi:uncharacterized protein LOC110272328 isoform X2 [Arachis ipaensis]|uniref:uncharacterized protein LOC110272328 isoform X2 n=1 Tax=Arachis ipaensis TaxID=130454 RepID=UPI000A2B42BF|nr:uncharacterized protein LOC110272328 isoform X2 [Arachis ipaensis]XP_025655528.1 uncharacterized protein LOC112750853 isoform X2 [Arachis hypogaea]
MVPMHHQQRFPTPIPCLHHPLHLFINRELTTQCLLLQIILHGFLILVLVTMLQLIHQIYYPPHQALQTRTGSMEVIVQHPTIQQWKALKRILQYLRDAD